MQVIGAEVSYYRSQIKVGYSLSGCEVSVDFNIPVTVIQRQFSIESSRRIFTVEHDVAVFILFVCQG